MDQEGEEMSRLNHRYQKYLDKFFKESSKRTRIVISLSVIALLLFLSAAALLPFKDKIFNYLYPKPKSQAVETYPPRGIEGDLWADVVIGQRDFSEITPKEIVPYRVFNPNGVTVDRSVSPGRAYVWDSSNNRVLGFDLAKCYAKNGEPCSADVVIGQPSGSDYGACNGDSGFQNYPQRAKASESSLCGIWEGTYTVLEDKTLSGMFADNQGNLYVPDVKNNRVLKYISPFTTNSVADGVWGQNDFIGNECNKTSDVIRETYANPTSSSICFQLPYSGAGAGVTVDTSGNLWVADGGNNRVLRFPIDPITKTASKSADRVIGQPDFSSYSPASGLNQMSSPTTVRFDNQGNLYVVDSGNNRILVFKPPFNSGMTANGGTGGTFGQSFVTPGGMEIDPAGKWILTYESDGQNERKVKFWNMDGSLYNTPSEGYFLPNNTRTGGSVGIDSNGDILFSLDKRGQDIYRYKVPLVANSSAFQPNKQFFNPILVTLTPPPNPAFGKAMQFNGQSALNITYSGSPLDNTTNFTIEMWINPKAGGTYQLIYAQLNGCYVGINPSNKVYFRCQADETLYGNTTLNTDGSKWYHLAAVINGNTVRLFINGKRDGEKNFTTNPTLSPNNNLLIGAAGVSGSTAQYAFAGYLDELRVSPATRYSADFTPPTSPFIADTYTWDLWHFNNNIVNDTRSAGVQTVGNVSYVDNSIPLDGVNTPPPPTPTPLPPFSYNLVSDKRLDNSAWVGMTVVGDQLVVAPGSRLLFWNGLNSLTNGKPADGYIGTSKINDFPDPGYSQMKSDADNRIWVLRSSSIEVYQAPLAIGVQPIKTITTIPVLGSNQQIDLYGTIGLAPTSHGEYLWVSQAIKNRVFRIRNPLSNNPVIDIVLGQKNFTTEDKPRNQTEVNEKKFDYLCNRGEIAAPNSKPNRPPSQDAKLDMLCMPGAISLDKKGNLFVSDHVIEGQGNWRLLMYPSSIFPVTPATVVFAPFATKEFPRWMTAINTPNNYQFHMTFEPSFDSTNRMVVGFSKHYWNSNSFVKFYNDPTKLNPSNPSDPSFAIPDGQLNDFYGWVVATAFDSNDNLYVFDANRSKVLIYKKPFIFTNLSANLPLEGPATFNFIYPAGSGPFKINVSTIADMSRDVYNNFASGGTSPITLDSPATVWNKYTCGRIVYWQITDATGTVKSPIQSTTISSNSPCPYVFATSTTYNGNLGGLAGADAKCQERATAVNLPGTYKAWLSDSTGSPSTRFNKSTAPYVLTDGTVVANNWDNLIAVDSSHYLKAAIRMTESKYTLYGPQTVDTAWSNSYANGTLLGTQRNCNNWTEGANGALYGDLGFIYANGYSWSFGGASAVCNTSQRLYCFRQDIPAPSPTSTPSLTPTSTPMAISLTSGLIGLWRLDDNSGTTAADGSSGNHPVTLSGSASWTAGKLNSAVALNGTTSYLDPISINGFGTLVGNSSYTVSLWTKTNIASTRQVILGDWDVNGASQSVALEFGGYNMPSDHITTLWTSDTGTRRYLDSGVVYSPNTWYHIVVSVDGTTGARNFYINGTLKNTDTVGKLGNGSKLTFGRAGAYNGIYLNGVIDDLRIYNRVLSAQEIQNLYNLTPASSGY